jgi:hypothetical protein
MSSKPGRRGGRDVRRIFTVAKRRCGWREIPSKIERSAMTHSGVRMQKVAIVAYPLVPGDRVARSIREDHDAQVARSETDIAVVFPCEMELRRIRDEPTSVARTA